MASVDAVIHILYVNDQSTSSIYYKAVLQLDPVLDVPGMTEFEIAPHIRLGLMPESRIAPIISPPMPDPASGNGVPRCELYLYVADPESYAQRAVEAGGEEVSPFSERNWGDRAVYVSDPDGHVLAFGKKIEE